MGAHQIRAPQRKDLDAAYAAAHGIPVPKVFETFDEAQDFVLHKGGKLIIRTEHPLEREGLSGLNFSHEVSLIDVEYDELNGGLFASFREFDSELLDYLMRDWHTKHGMAKFYCRENGLNLDDYLAGLTHSYWEYVSGHNLYVVADPVISNRYRIFAGWWEIIDGHRKLLTSYNIFDSTTPTSTSHTPQAVFNKIDDIVRLYNKVREVFGQEMCWVVEMQLAAHGELYFLQRSVGQPFNPCKWSFESQELCHFLVGLKYGYGEVRGMTPKEGVEVTFLLERGTRMRYLKGYKPSAILNAHIDCLVVEQKTLESVGVYIQTRWPVHGDGARDPHSTILPLVRAPLYLYLPDLHDRLPPDIGAEVKRLGKIKREGVRAWYCDPNAMVQITLHIRSDGNEARINVQKVD